MLKKLIVFDLDGTLAESKSPLDDEMSALMHDLLSVVKVAVISGGDWLQFEKQVLSGLPHDKSLENLSILPTCGTKFYQYDIDWKKIYSEDFTADEKKKIISSLNKSIESVLHVKDESDVDSLFTSGGTTALMNNIKGLEDFELLTFVVIQ